MAICHCFLGSNLAKCEITSHTQQQSDLTLRPARASSNWFVYAQSLLGWLVNLVKVYVKTKFEAWVCCVYV
jgi:hypothetical protein